MSLLKALNITTDRPKYDAVRLDFVDVVSTIIDKPTRTDAIVLVKLYTDYSINYLVDVAQTLNEPKNVQQTMKFMNSYIAEILTSLGLHYFHQEGHTVIDKAVQKALDNNGVIKYDDIEDIINEIEASYVEDVIEE